MRVLGRKAVGWAQRVARAEGWAGRTGRKVLANTIDLPVALRVLAHLHGEVNPQWHDLAQVVNVQTQEAADLVGVRVGLRLGPRLRVRLRVTLSILPRASGLTNCAAIPLSTPSRYGRGDEAATPGRTPSSRWQSIGLRNMVSGSTSRTYSGGCSVSWYVLSSQCCSAPGLLYGV